MSYLLLQQHIHTHTHTDTHACTHLVVVPRGHHARFWPERILHGRRLRQHARMGAPLNFLELCRAAVCMHSRRARPRAVPRRAAMVTALGAAAAAAAPATADVAVAAAMEAWGWQASS